MFVSLDQSTDLMTFKSTSDADIGQYIADLKVFLIEKPEISLTVQFTVTVQPCKITDFFISMETTTVYYNVGDPEKNTANYQLTQKNDCGYTPTITIDQPTDYIHHNPDSQDFSIYTISTEA